MDGFEEANDAFIQFHLNQRSGERKGRLERGYGHAEILFAKNVWWPLKGNFNYLHPEYEVLDWRGRSYFADYLYMPKSCKMIIEIKGFGEHVTNMDRKKYCSELNRETFLTGMGFHVISFSYDDVAQRPELCIHLLRIVLSRFESENNKVERIFFADNEVIRLAISLARPIRPIDVTRHFSINPRTSVVHLQRLCKKGWLKPLLRGTGQRTLYYELTRQGLDSGFL
ncbi:DUF559 domain-containing protein [Paenibacillus sp. IITD108]|uniref:DUF559 domain-containing protein n=1 Tax=Paenibacillus sp. IITD108 TaxID=3116649 RepID=UPI002F424994